MATRLILPLSLCLLVLSCSAAQQWPWQSRESAQKHRGQFQQQCDIQRLTASEPSRRLKSEAGVTEIWDQNTPEFRCTGFVALRLVIQPGGLLLPSFTNAPYLTFVEQGRGVQGVIVPGCPETFQSESELDSESSRDRRFRPSEGREEGDDSRRFREEGDRHFRPSEGREQGDESRRFREEGDQHQKVFRIREGDVIPSPAGVVQWTHNDGDSDLISITLIDSNSFHNQLDQDARSFFLAGQGSREQGRHQRQEHRSDRQSQEGVGGSILSGFDDEILRQVFPGVKQETISKLRGENDDRGFIVQARDLQVRVPEESQEEEEREQQRERGQRRERGSGRRGSGNGVEQSLCNLKFRHNIDRPAQADVFNPRAGRINTINSNSLPILEFLRLSAEHVTLYKNAIIGPRWSLNAHSALYVTRGEGRAQVVGDEGNTVFDEVLQKGQILVIPQGFAVVVKAGKQGIEWVDVKTNDNAISSPIAGRTSVLRAIPAEVLASAYDISREEAVRLKTGRREIEVFRPFESREERQRGQFSIV